MTPELCVGDVFNVAGSLGDTIEVVAIRALDETSYVTVDYKYVSSGRIDRCEWPIDAVRRWLDLGVITEQGCL